VIGVDRIAGGFASVKCEYSQINVLYMFERVLMVGLVLGEDRYEY
jgi:hypothetical protein